MAEQLHVTAGAISRQIRQLEAHVDAALFTRAAHGVRLTARGMRLARAAERALSKLSDGVDAACREDRAASPLTVSACRR